MVLNKKVRISLWVGLLYFLSTLTLGVVATLFSVFFALRTELQAAKMCSVVGRGALFPYFLIAGKTQIHFFQAWENGLKLIEFSPKVALNVKQIYSAYQHGQPLTSESLTQLHQNYSHTLILWGNFQRQVSQSFFARSLLSHTQYKTLSEQLQKNTPLLQATDTFLQFTANKLQSQQNMKFLVLFQNNMELRATGGFPGSFAIITFGKDQPMSIEIQDIYVPDGQLKEHVDPPLPIQEAFQQGFWKLRDANWHPDFPESVSRIQWFFNQVQYEEFDGVVAINFSLILELLKITGPISVPDLNTQITSENVYPILQRSEDNSFFAGSTQKKDILSSFNTQLLLALQKLSLPKMSEGINLLSQQLNEKQILVHFDDSDLQTLMTLNNWNGRLRPVSCDTYSCVTDYFSIFEANLGVNKSNCCVKRSVSLNKTLKDTTQLETEIQLQYHNLGPGTSYQKVAGDYKAFVRIYVPKNSDLEELKINGQLYTEYIRQMKSVGHFHPITSEGFSWGDVYEMKELGFWIVVKSEADLSVQIKTSSQLINSPTYILNLQKQSGVQDMFNNFNISLNNSPLFSGELLTDKTFSQKL